jgi:hypothetical protein
VTTNSGDSGPNVDVCTEQEPNGASRWVPLEHQAQGVPHLWQAREVRGSNPRCSTPKSISRARRQAGFLMPTATGGTQKGTQSVFEYHYGTSRHAAARLEPKASSTRTDRRRTRLSLVAILRTRSLGLRGWPRQVNGCCVCRQSNRRLALKRFRTKASALVPDPVD